MSARNTIREFENMYIPEPMSGCWLWLGPLVSQRSFRQYGRVCWYSGPDQPRQRLAHVKSYELYVGKIPEGKVLDHICRNTFCVNPEHLEPVTQWVNMQRSKAAAKTHCVRGHPYSDGMEIYIRNDKHGKQYRRCLTCYRLKYPGTAK